MKKENNAPIDFVIAWVDGGDKQWLAEKNKYLAEYFGLESVIDQGEYRYRDWELMPYWFRAVEKYAPWVRTIHFVTCGQHPDWLKKDHPKLHYVDHKDYIPKEYLPTFNSHTIELNMHRIEGLSEQFVYFNDDMFITKPVKPEDFFENGLPKDVFALDCIYHAEGSAGPYNSNDITVINNHFNKDEQFKKHRKKWFKLCYGKKKLYQTAVLLPWHWFPGLYYQHLPGNFLKSTLEEVWEKEGKLLDETSRSKFRGKEQVNQWLFKYWQLADGKFMPKAIKDGRCYHLKDKGVEDLCQSIREKKYQLICINDTDKTTDFEQKKADIIKAFEAVLPEKSSFEC